MPWLGWVIVGLGVLEGGWMLFDGGRALVVGDYVTPNAGRHAGRLGPWAHLVRGVGLEPRSTVVKVGLILLGLAWLAAAAGFGGRSPWGWWAMLGCAVLSLWYVPVGTLLSVLQIGLLLLPAVRAACQGSA
ncbi:MAG: hypothetical protein KA383_09355 [Phycisphaerae bacterium]|nr:hypothetical protein [Phycisphaerae bacterium]